jgi:hypothetical protein
VSVRARPNWEKGGKFTMPIKLAEAEKNRDKTAKSFEDAQDALEKAFKKWQNEKNDGKKVGLLKHIQKPLREAIAAGEDYDAAEEAFEEAEKAGSK